ncbi:MAG: peptide chain release factor N(5)-glutamine methyltransferase [Pseudomonadota bacterium]
MTPSGAKSVRQVLAAAAGALEMAGVEGAARDARRLLAHAMGVAADRISLMGEEPVPKAALVVFGTSMSARADGRPVSRIVGGRWFYGRWFEVTDDVLDPRPETETLVAAALEDPFERVLDLGTGSGAIIVTLLAEREGAKGVGSDLSEAAVLVAGANAARHSVDDRVVFPSSDWWDDIGGRYDLIVSNPPYIAAAEMDGLAREVRDHDPHLALTDGDDGLSAYRVIAAGAPAYLTPGGRLMVEVGAGQAGAVSALFEAAGLENIETRADLDGRERVVLGRFSPKTAS